MRRGAFGTLGLAAARVMGWHVEDSGSSLQQGGWRWLSCTAVALPLHLAGNVEALRDTHLRISAPVGFDGGSGGLGGGGEEAEGGERRRRRRLPPSLRPRERA